jgi:protocadherin alpha
MGGVLKPNDGRCHLDGSGMYQQSLIQDYPSLGHISRLVQDNAINLIFAVTEDVSSTYNEFSLRIPGSSVGKLAADSENIVDIIRDKYQQISSSVELRDTAKSGVKLRYYTACLGSLVQERNRCDQLKADDTVNFIVNVEVFQHFQKTNVKIKQALKNGILHR